MAGQIYQQLNLNKEYLKIRWKEPYVSDALNKKMFGVFAKGIYSGFVITQTGFRQVTVGPGSVSGGLGTGMNAGYVSGGHDETIGFSVAIQQSDSGYSKTIMLPQTAPTYSLDLTGREGQRVFVILDSTYQIGAESSVRLSAVNGEYIDQDPTVIVVGHVDVPNNVLVSLSPTDIGYNDPIYPRLTPLSNPNKAGFMPASAWEKLDQVFSWEELCKPYLSLSNNFLIEIKPSQKKVSSKRIYTYISSGRASKFPRNSAGAYNGGVSNDQVALLDIVNGTIGGAHQVIGNDTFPIASVSGTPDMFQVGLVMVSQSDNIEVVYGATHGALIDALDDDALPAPSGDKLPICFFVVETDSIGDIKPMNSVYSIMDARPFLNLTGSSHAVEEYFTVGIGGQTVFTTSGFIFATEHTIPDITVFVNGNKVKQSPDGNPANGDFVKTNSNTITFATAIPQNAEVTIRNERGSGSGTSAQINLNNLTADIAPDISGARAVGTVAKGFKSVFLKDTTSSQVYEIKVVAGVIQTVPVP